MKKGKKKTTNADQQKQTQISENKNYTDNNLLKRNTGHKKVYRAILLVLKKTHFETGI